jgi:hypothetical protein
MRISRPRPRHKSKSCAGRVRVYNGCLPGIKRADFMCEVGGWKSSFSRLKPTACREAGWSRTSWKNSRNSASSASRPGITSDVGPGATSGSWARRIRSGTSLPSPRHWRSIAMRTFPTPWPLSTTGDSFISYFTILPRSKRSLPAGRSSPVGRWGSCPLRRSMRISGTNHPKTWWDCSPPPGHRPSAAGRFAGSRLTPRRTGRACRWKVG